MKRMNLGCGSVQPEGWDNVDGRALGQPIMLDVAHFGDGEGSLQGLLYRRGDNGLYQIAPIQNFTDYDYIVCNHMLSDIGHHDLPAALSNIRAMLKDGGVLRILVPNVIAAFQAVMQGNEGWFPQDEQTPGIEAKFCTFVTWYGESRSIFTPSYLDDLLMGAGFTSTNVGLPPGVTTSGVGLFEGITDLDGDRTTALVAEAIR